MNKQNTEKLISIINLLDKISERSDVKNPKYGKLKSFYSSEVSKTYDTLENQKPMFPLHCENDTRDFSASKINDKIKKTKSFFYFNKSYSSERDESSCGDKGWVATGKVGDVAQNEGQTEHQAEPQTEPLREEVSERLSEYPKGAHEREQRPRKEDSTEGVNNKYTHFQDIYEEGKKSQGIRETTDCVKGSNQGAKTNTTFSFESEGFSSAKWYTGSFHFKRKSQHEARHYFSDTALLEYNNPSRKKKNLLEMLKRHKVRKYQEKCCEDSVDNSAFIAPSKKYGYVHGEVDADEYLDDKGLGQLLEKIIEHLNVNLKESMNIYVKEINKLNKANDTLSTKLETAVENNDEQAQEIRDLNKRISQIGEEKIEMNKRIENYEFTIHKSKKLKNEGQGDNEAKSALEMEIRNLKRELNLANSLNDKIKDEKLSLQEKIKSKTDKIRREKDKEMLTSVYLACMCTLVSKMAFICQMRKSQGNTYIILFSDNKKRKEGRRCSVRHRRRHERISSYRSDTIVDNYERVKSKLLESNEKCYFLSKTNLELFKGLKRKRKKIDTLNKQMSYLKCFVKGKEKMDRCDEYHLKQENSTHGCDHMERNKSHVPCAEEYKPSQTSEHNSLGKMSYYVQEGEIEGLEKNYHNLTNEHKLLKKKYELLYKKYARLLGKDLNKSNDLAFKKEQGEEIVPNESDMIHSFYVKRGKNRLDRPFQRGENLKRTFQRRDNLINYIKAKVIHRKNLHVRRFRNYAEKGNDYSDVQFYVSNEILRNMDVKDIVNIRYIYSYGEGPAVLPSEKESSPNYNICKC
ncbi:hypothetical protein AK88_04112 [Plasmodium fragile]|uniref:Uncharacterized protein n=1 Tax=Plasmodium fragile TaxID=5857 RepID=A0A0D9QGY4_PLAFR|nr:uncharacterized protein AK88_04112 [Plasmodium fragile]KJP86218.1 hypothetical protein AK88_04112 [Plasmodium fragile]